VLTATEQKPEPQKTLIVWDDLWYAARWWLINECVVGFEVFKINGIHCETQEHGAWVPSGTKGCPPGISLEKRDEVACGVAADDLDDADVYVSGHIKWDGCSDIEFPSTKTCMMHLCGRKAWVDLTVLFYRLFDTLAMKIPRMDCDIVDEIKGAKKC